MQPLTPAQLEAYSRDGYLLAGGFIPSDIAEAAEQAMWRAMNLGPNRPPEWANRPKGHSVYEDHALVACYTPQFLAAAAALSGDDPATFRAPSRAYAINVFPQEGPWKMPLPHIDHAIKEHGHRTFPRAFRIASMTFLSDVEEHGGGTVVWPGSHRRIEAMARSDPERFELMWTVNQSLDEADLGEPLELYPKRGDVLLYHYLCAHAGSMNTTDRPRLAMNAKW